MEEISELEFFGKERGSETTPFKLSQIREENGDTSVSVEESFREGKRGPKKAQNDRRQNEGLGSKKGWTSRKSEMLNRNGIRRA